MIKGLTEHAVLELRTGVRDRTLLLMTYLFPLGFYGFMGAFMTEMNPLFVDVMIPGMAVFAMLAAAMFGLPTPLITRGRLGCCAATGSTACPSPPCSASRLPRPWRTCSSSPR